MEHVLNLLMHVWTPDLDQQRTIAAQRAHNAQLQQRIDRQNAAEAKAAEARHRELGARALGVKVGLR